MTTIYHKGFVTLNRDGDTTRYYILCDGWYRDSFYASSDEEAIAKFKRWRSNS